MPTPMPTFEVIKNPPPLPERVHSGGHGQGGGLLTLALRLIEPGQAVKFRGIYKYAHAYLNAMKARLPHRYAVRTVGGNTWIYCIAKEDA